MSDSSMPEPFDAAASGDQVRQAVTGDRNQVIAKMSGGTAIANVETLIQNLQQPRSPESARYSLPVDAADFTGREDEIRQSETDLSAGRVVSIVGMAGVGKSALAVRVAHRLKAQFPGGQIYLNLQGEDTQPLSVDAALETLLRALGVDPAQMPTQRAERAAMYRSRMAQALTLVLLDNATDARQVEDLLPGAGACLITSRQQLDGLAGIKLVNLDPLPEAEALELFQKMLPIERVQAEVAAARQIVEYCGRLPLALRIAAATLVRRSWQGRRLVDYAQQFADERQRLDRLRLDNLDIRASFELSYQELETTAAQLLGWLGLLAGDFGTDILMPLSEKPAEPIQTALAALVDGRLVDPLALDPSAERYVLHDLMRLFALEKLETQTELAVVQAAKVRLVQWCGEQANTWADALNPGRRRQWAEAIALEQATNESGEPTMVAADLEPRLFQMALSWFEAERQTLVQAFNWAAETQQWQASVALAAKLAAFFNLRGYWGEWVSTHQQALTAARQAGDVHGEGQTLGNLGNVYESQGKRNEAIDCHEQSLKICRVSGDVHGEGQTLGNLGNVYGSQGKWNEAIDCHEQSLKIFRAIGDVQGEGKSLGNLGSVYLSQGKWNEAIDCHEQSLKICQAIGDVHGEGQTLGNLGNVYESQGKWNEAIDCHEQSLKICRAIGDVHGEGQSINNLGLVYKSQGKWNEAIDCYEQSLKIKRAIGDVHGEGSTLNNLGSVYRSQGKWNEAIDCCEQSLKIFRAIGDVHGEGQTLGNLGNVYESQGKWNEAIDCHEQSLKICRAIGDVHGEGATLNNLGLVYLSQGKWNEAIDCHEQSLKICQAIGDVHGEGQTLGNLGNVYESQGKWNEAIDCHEQSLKICRAIGDVHGEGKSLGNLGSVYLSQGKWNEAIDCHEQSLKIKRAIGDVHGEGLSLNNLGVVYSSQGNWNEAIDCYEQSLKICRAIGDVHGEGQTLTNLGNVCKRQKHLEQAVAYWREALTKLHSDSPEHANVTRWLQAATQRHHPVWQDWLLPLGSFLFLVWNLVNGHWIIALLCILVLIGWQWLRRRR